MTKQQYYRNKQQQFITGQISSAEWFQFCWLYLASTVQYRQMCQRMGNEWSV
jgi:hypothetical protein